MEFKTYSSPHLPVTGSVSIMMQRVLLALIPGTLCAFWIFGWGILFNILLAMKDQMLSSLWHGSEVLSG